VGYKRAYYRMGLKVVKKMGPRGFKFLGENFGGLKKVKIPFKGVLF